jgi:carbon-monoxide dehydrogenase medium subunit
MAGVSIRNIATIGGNLCNASPAADTSTPLLALDAELTVLSRHGRRVIPIVDFFTGPGKTVLSSEEVLTQISIAVVPRAYTFIKIGQRKTETLAIISTAVSLIMADTICLQARIALGSVAPRPLRCPKAEEALIGQAITLDLCTRSARIAAEYASPIDDGRATAWYRRRMAPVLVKRALLKAVGIEESQDDEIHN